MERQKLVVTGWSCISPFGIGRSEFRDGVAEGVLPMAELSPLLDEGETAPFASAPIASTFETRAMLGKKGTRTLDRLTGLTIATVGLTLEDGCVEPDEQREGIGIAVGSSQGSLKSISGFTRETLIHERPEFVNPALFPNTVMNCAAGQTAIWHRCRGPNVTISAGNLSGLAAIRFAMRSLRYGYAEMFIAGGSEEMTASNAWAYSLTTSAETQRYAPLSEGCAMFAIEPAEKARNKGKRVHAELVGTAMASYDNSAEASEESKVAALADCVQRLLEDSNVAPADISLICTSRYDPQLAAREDAAVARVFGAGAVLLPANELMGNSISASAAFQLAILLARLEADNSPVSRLGLLLAVDGGGSMGCLLIKNGG